MILAVDMYYYEAGAKVVGVLFESFDSKAPIDIIKKLLPPQKEYEPGAFYKRELPCILELVNTLNREYIELIIVDGYVYLDDHKKKGLGSYVFEALDTKIPVIGVAKSYFFTSAQLVAQVYRGESKKPLYVSAVGIELNKAKEYIQQMHGEYRMPYLLKLMDTETKKN
ncbi:endonuclease V [Myroides albus]|uniref:endonuclease V n=1 Tax=Myroides albus TaxID=2562892 RepID=UPI002159980F|nr:endonuclease V [Myroides albus]UVD78983.1 endonuclease V [Myroides albus]